MSYRFAVDGMPMSGSRTQPNHPSLALDDAGKAITTFEMDIVACYTALVILSSETGLEPVDHYGPECGGKVRRIADQEVYDRVFEDSMGICEFFLNRITPLADKPIKQILVHTRFTLAYVLSVDPACEGHVLQRKGYRKNLAMFTHNAGDSDEFRHISHIEFDSCFISERFDTGEYTCSEISESLDIGTTCASYYDCILSELSHGSGSIVVGISETDASSLGYPGTLIPLTRLVSDLTERCKLIRPLCFHIDRDLKDMMNDRVCEDDAMLGKVRVRDSNMESTASRINAVYEGNAEIMEDIVWFSRILNCIIASSDVGSNHDWVLKFRPEMLARLLDPDIFGKRYVAPDMCFVDCEDLLGEYLRSISRYESKDGRYRIKWAEENDVFWKPFKRTWPYSGRQSNSDRNEDVVSVMEKPLFSTLDRLIDPSKSPILSKGKIYPAIIVVGIERLFDLVSSLALPERKQILQAIRMIVVVSPGSPMMVTKNRETDEIPEVVIGDVRELFGIHTEFALQKMTSAARAIEDGMTNPRDPFEERIDDIVRACCERATRIASSGM